MVIEKDVAFIADEIQPACLFDDVPHSRSIPCNRMSVKAYAACFAVHPNFARGRADGVMESITLVYPCLPIIPVRRRRNAFCIHQPVAECSRGFSWLHEPLPIGPAQLPLEYTLRKMLFCFGVHHSLVPPINIQFLVRIKLPTIAFPGPNPRKSAMRKPVRRFERFSSS